MKKLENHVRRMLAKSLGSDEDAVLKSVEQMDIDEETKEAIRQHNIPFSTGQLQLASLQTFAALAFSAVLVDGAFMYQDDGDGYSTLHYIAFQDMVTLYNTSDFREDVIRMVPKVYLRKEKGNIVCTKDRMNFGLAQSPTA